MQKYLSLAIILVVIATSRAGFTYPLDGYDTTGMRRIEAARLSVLGKLRGRAQPPGARLPIALVDLRLLDHAAFDLPEPDPAFTAEIVALLGNNMDRYGLAVLDLSDPNHPRLALHRADYKQNVGSVGKIVVAATATQLSNPAGRSMSLPLP